MPNIATTLLLLLMAMPVMPYSYPANMASNGGFALYGDGELLSNSAELNGTNWTSVVQITAEIVGEGPQPDVLSLEIVAESSQYTPVMLLACLVKMEK
jgi:hypothetical protein